MIDDQDKTKEEFNLELAQLQREHYSLKAKYQKDITDRKRNEKELLEKEARLQEAQRIGQMGHWDLDVITNKLIWSDETYRIFGLKPQEFKATYAAFLDRIHPDDREKVNNAYINSLKTKKPYSIEHRFLLKTGELKYVLEQCKTEFDKHGKPLRSIGTVQDITKHKKAEEELRLAKEKAEESDKLKSAFLANMSHEIRTPMNGILGFSELMNDPNITGSERQDYFELIKKSSDRMLNILGEIMDIAKIESGLMEVNIREISLNEQIEQVYYLLKSDAEDKGLNFSFKNSLPVNETLIKTDSQKLYSILSNLVKNAIKYTDKGSVEFGYNKKGNHLEFYVKDTGIGIPEDRQEAIFERFIQADIADIEARQGVGLGLSISKAFVEMLGGKIWVVSEIEKGSIFYFTLPSSVKKEEKSVINDVSSGIGAYNQVKNMKILIVEDDAPSEMLLSIYVKEFCNEVLKARSGSEAIEICRNNPDIDLILMDIQMFDLNGYEATRQIRQFNEDAIIIAQTAFGLSGDRKKAIEAGCNDYISKPIRKSELLALIQKYF